MHTILWLKNLTGRDHSEDLGVDGRIRFIWLRIRTSGRLL